MYLTLNKIIVFISYLAPNSKPKKEKRKKPSFYEANKREREREPSPRLISPIALRNSRDWWFVKKLAILFELIDGFS